MTDDAFGATVVGPAPSLGTGTLFAGRYRIEGALGQGGMGAVFCVQDTSLDERVALKILALPADKAAEAVARFRREVRVARRITHGNVARTYDLGEHEGVHFLTMELIEGESLQPLLGREAPLSAERAAAIAVQMCDGLAAAHAAGVVHRDLKPANVLIERGGRVVITDFGIARMIEDERGTLDTVGAVGTPAYMAPEQVTGQTLDARTDLYAFGIVLFEMVTGRLPFEGPTPLAAATARLLSEPPDPRELAAVPEELAALVLRCLARDPGERPAGAGEISAALQGLAPPSAGERRALCCPAPARADASPPTGGGTRSFAPTSPGSCSLGVLPFRHRGAGDDGAVLAEGLTDELIDVLSMTRGLRVLASGATAAYRDRRDPRIVGSELAVDVIVDGTVQQAGDKVRITARLIQVEGGVQVWRGTFEGGLEDVFSLQESMSKRIAEVLRLELDTFGYGGDAPAEAVQLYFLARRKLHAFDVLGPDGAHALLERCLELAPQFRPALAFHAMVCLRCWFLPSPADGRDWEDEARRSVARALAEADELAETQLAAAGMAVFVGDYPEAARRLARALSIAPTCAEAHDYLGRLQCEAGRPQEGVRHLELAFDLDPKLTSALIAIGRHEALHGNLDACERMFARARAAAGGPFMALLQTALRVYSWYQDHPRLREVLAELEQYDHDAGRFAAMAVRYSLGEFSSDEIDAIGAKMLPGASDNPRFRALADQVMAELHAVRGRPDLAMTYLTRVADRTLVDLEWIDHCPALAPLRDLPGYDEARRKVRARAEAIWLV